VNVESEIKFFEVIFTWKSYNYNTLVLNYILGGNYIKLGSYKILGKSPRDEVNLYLFTSIIRRIRQPHDSQ